MSNNIYTISNNRKKFSVFLNFLSEQEWHGNNALKEVAGDFKNLAEKWKILTGMFYKSFYIGTEDTSLLKRISLKVQETADLERQLYKSLTGVLKYGQAVGQQKPLLSPDVTRCETLDVEEWFNNIAFGSKIGWFNSKCRLWAAYQCWGPGSGDVLSKP